MDLAQEREKSGEIIDKKLNIAAELTPEQIEYNDKIFEARKVMQEFNSHFIGVSAIHPELNPYHWPPPRGQNISKPETNVLRKSFTDNLENPKELYEHYTLL